MTSISITFRDNFGGEVFIGVKNDRRRSRGNRGGKEGERESNDGAIIVAARYIIRTFANLLARGHRRSARTRGRGAILHGAEYVPCVSDFIISVRRNVRRATKARKRDLMQGIRQGPARHPGSGINEGRNPIPFPPSPSQSPLSFPSSAVSHSLASSSFAREKMDEVHEEPARFASVGTKETRSFLFVTSLPLCAPRLRR